MMTMMDFSDTASLRSLHKEVQNTLLLTGKLLKHQPKTLNTNDAPQIPSLNLPSPDNVDEIFSDITLPPQLLGALNDKYRQSLHEIQRIHRQKFEESCRELCRVPQTHNTYPLPRLMEDLRMVYEARYINRFVPMMRDQIFTFRARHLSMLIHKKIPFNPEYIPLLEKYFEHNAYPSAPDRQVLAHKTTMTPRQIEVWFQNHRKRAKESGKAIKRMSPNSSHLFPPSHKIISPTIETVVSSDSGSERSKVNPIVIETAISLHSTDPDIASRIFPFPFSPSNAIYHFHTDTSFSFPSPVWTRKPSSRSIPQSDIDLDGFIATFACKLNIRDGLSKNKRKFHSQAQNPWFSATTTVPSVAPHPACIRIVQPPALPILPIRSLFARTSFPSTSTQPPTTTSLPSPIMQPQIHKKVAPFPKRYPSKFHPYSHAPVSTPCHSSRVHSVGSVPSFGSRASAMKCMPSRASNAVTMLPTPYPGTGTWITALEITPYSANKTANLMSIPSSLRQATNDDHTPPPARIDTSVNSILSSANRVTSMEPMTPPGSRIASLNSNSSFGSRTSSLSSVESPLPVSPTLQPQLNDTIILEHQDLQFLDAMSDFDQLMTGHTQMSYSGDLFSPKSDMTFGYVFPYLQNAITSFPMNFMQTMS